ncbi:TetR/AcrR family transcriptional regulator [Natronoglycomyces albus]|uniref:TetR/AcrR family transcriptional regulator n=1 Tax=Natronoglycomyces albus TaxID=2811108 RepID=A0A895XIJ0_9ACTN|nr:TetR/AcrR family transcriptional regulator [Natronoglycomyces albus]QSB05621.1 TetR/AcrR family transcriptional regulator [Natronoglycomyces albus]
MNESDQYHHGNLRQALLAAAIGEIETHGPSAVSLRAVAKAAGVSHSAPAHHFGDKAGLLTALAAEGYHKFADALEAKWAQTGDFAELGIAYVQFALDHRTYFGLMYRLELLRENDPDLQAGRTRAYNALQTGADAATSTGEAQITALAGWSLVHGYATLLLAGNLPESLAQDPAATARLLTQKLQP